MDFLASAEELPDGRIVLSFILAGDDAKAVRRWPADHIRNPSPGPDGHSTEEQGQ
jgi:hypothetical protein